METEDTSKTDMRSKVLLAVFGTAIILSVGVSFYRYMVVRDYIIEAQVDCDPTAEACFVYECDPESEDPEAMCTGSPEEDIWYYRIIHKNAMNISACDDQNQEACASLTCAENEKECGYTFCEEGNADGVRCSTAEDAAVLMNADGDEPGDESDELDAADNQAVSGDTMNSGDSVLSESIV